MSFVTAPRDIRVTGRDVRVTERRSEAVKVDFIPPETAPVPTHVLEMQKGLTGWTDTDKKVETVTPVFPVYEDNLTVGNTVIRQAPRKITRVISAGPSASYRAAQARAAELAERGRAEARARKARKNQS